MKGNYKGKDRDNHQYICNTYLVGVFQWFREDVEVECACFEARTATPQPRGGCGLKATQSKLVDNVCMRTLLQLPVSIRTIIQKFLFDPVHKKSWRHARVSTR